MLKKKSAETACMLRELAATRDGGYPRMRLSQAMFKPWILPSPLRVHSSPQPWCFEEDDEA